MHVKLVVNSFPKSSETFLFNLVTGLEKNGVKVTVCATLPSGDISFYKYKLKEWSGNIQYLPGRNNMLTGSLQIIAGIIARPSFFFDMVKEKGFRKGVHNFIYTTFFLKENPDIIHFSFSGIGISYLECFPYLRSRRVKTVVSCRGTAEKVKPLLDPERVEKLRQLFSEVDLVHCVSKDMRDYLLRYGLPPEKAFINYPSIDVDKFKKASLQTDDLNKFNIVTTGSLNFSKGYIFALLAMKILKERGYSFMYHILGEGEDRPMMTYMIQQLNLTNEVNLHGRVSSLTVSEQLNNADIFLLSSVNEGVSNAALEAMAMELPVVSTHAGGMAEVIEHGVNGLLTDWRSPEHMSDQLAWVYDSPTAGIDMGKKARATVENLFSLDRQIDIFLDQYQELLSKEHTY